MNGLLEFQQRNPMCDPLNTTQNRKSAEKLDSPSSSNKRKAKSGTEVIFPKVDIDTYNEILKFSHGEKKTQVKMQEVMLTVYHASCIESALKKVFTDSLTSSISSAVFQKS
ncbi:hypothetical protein AVEN_222475-1 [Araneus ventricosus]|uniref:Uncharacterized protein n=1 Tax=Araneus ventricosus TaxID=182803 RepID=A0A4Y2RLR3_ARAVE|nr:hypothetical protein AVEN_40038-1 [Araneus ventricosus]GBN76199.1 hypothetical protein AVEN_114030-1 [Araneus ventricosus]GBN76205.1 hypothetical protein AVEN_127648-1 [Araneus ventricosus]GBN76230.1 hypothetical protein AVEN_222475-1 [Araneus ventricosus]